MSSAIEEIIADAVAIVEASSIPGDLRPVAFAKIMDLLAAQSLQESSISGPDSDRIASVQSSGWMDALVAATSLPQLYLEEIFFVDNEGNPLVGIDPIRLGDNAAERARKIVLLLVCARQIGGMEQSTESKLLREECERVGVYDRGNFGKTLNGLKDWFHITGARSEKAVRLKPSGRDVFRGLVSDLTERHG